MVWVIGIGIALFLLFAFPRQAFGLIAVLVAIGCIVIGHLYWVDEQEKAKTALVRTTATYNPTFCTDARWPIQIEISNGSNQSIDEVTFYLSAFKTGYSSAQYGGYLTSDRIIAPRTTFTNCWSLNDYSWTAEPKIASFYNWEAKTSSVRWTVK